MTPLQDHHIEESEMFRRHLATLFRVESMEIPEARNILTVFGHGAEEEAKKDFEQKMKPHVKKIEHVQRQLIKEAPSEAQELASHMMREVQQEDRLLKVMHDAMRSGKEALVREAVDIIDMLAREYQEDQELANTA